MNLDVGEPNQPFLTESLPKQTFSTTIVPYLATNATREKTVCCCALNVEICEIFFLLAVCLVVVFFFFLVGLVKNISICCRCTHGQLFRVASRTVPVKRALLVFLLVMQGEA